MVIGGSIQLIFFLYHGLVTGVFVMICIFSRHVFFGAPLNCIAETRPLEGRYLALSSGVHIISGGVGGHHSGVWEATRSFGQSLSIQVFVRGGSFLSFSRMLQPPKSLRVAWFLGGLEHSVEGGYRRINR